MTQIKKGDTVYLQDDHFDFNQKGVPKEYKDIQTPKKNEPYTVRELVSTPDGVGIRLEEIVNNKIWHDVGGLQEPVFAIERFFKKS